MRKLDKMYAKTNEETTNETDRVACCASSIAGMLWSVIRSPQF